jgi:hypothetical protein
LHIHLRRGFGPDWRVVILGDWPLKFKGETPILLCRSGLLCS